MSKRVIELIRVSTEGQAAEDRAGIPAQRAVNRRTASHYGLEIVRTIEISDVSGAAVLRSPEIRQLLELITSPDIHGVVAKEFSRLMRPENFGDYALLQAFADTRTLLYLPDGPIDFGSKTGRLLGGIRALMAGEERSDILERSWQAKEAKRRQGKSPQSYITLPYGVGYTQACGWFYEAEADKVREAFRLFLSGETNYWLIGKKLGIDPCNLRIILRNPIYSGWRIIDKRRDPSPGALKTKADGRQGDRPKIKRAAEDIIRVKVNLEPLISEADFARLQSILEIKKTKHWRCDPKHVPHFTYNGFLSCSGCGELVYTYTNRKEHRYYVCKAKHYPKQTGHPCATKYMRRQELEERLDTLFAARLTDAGFLGAIMDEQQRRSADTVSQSRVQRLQNDISSLRAKRQRVLDTFIEGLILRDERDARLAAIDRDAEIAEGLLMREIPAAGPSAADLADVFQPFNEWSFLNRAQKRRLLSSLVPEIRVADYTIEGFMLLQPSADCNRVSHMGMGSWPLPA